jgi:hypothetical protein
MLLTIIRVRIGFYSFLKRILDDWCMVARINGNRSFHKIYIVCIRVIQPVDVVSLLQGKTSDESVKPIGMGSSGKVPEKSVSSAGVTVQESHIVVRTSVIIGNDNFCV